MAMGAKAMACAYIPKGSRRVPHQICRSGDKPMVRIGPFGLVKMGKSNDGPINPPG